MKIPHRRRGRRPQGITSAVQGTQGIGYDTIASLKGVVQMDKLDDNRAVILVQDQAGALNLETVNLP